MVSQMSKLQHLADQMLAPVCVFPWTKESHFLGAFTGGEIFGIIVGTFGLVGMLYVSYTKRYDIEYFVSSYIPSNTGIVVKVFSSKKFITGLSTT